MAKEKNAFKNGGFDMEEEMTEPVEGEEEMVEDTEEMPGETDEPMKSTGATIEVTPMDVPEVEGLQPGDTVSISAECSVKKVSGDKYTLQVESFMTTEAATEPSAGGEQAGGGLAGLLGG